MWAPVQSCASLSATASANSDCAGCSGVVAVSWTRNNRLAPSRCIRAATRFTQQTPIPRQTVEPVSERGARPQGVLDEVERATGQRLGEMDAECFVASETRREAPRLVGHRLRDTNAWVHELGPAEQPAKRRGIDAAALNPRDEVRQDPALNGRRNGRACVEAAHDCHRRVAPVVRPFADSPRLRLTQTGSRSQIRSALLLARPRFVVWRSLSRPPRLCRATQQFAALFRTYIPPPRRTEAYGLPFYWWR